MGIEQDNILEERIKKIKEENISFRESLSSLKSENENLRKFIGEGDLIFHSDPSGIIILQKGKIVNINNTMLDTLGYAHSEIIGMKLPDLFHHDDLVLIKEILKKIQSGKISSEQYEIKLLNRSGNSIICDLWIKKIRLRNKIAYLLNFGFIERFKRIETENYQKKKREAMVIMASGISRELHRCLSDVGKNVKEMESIVRDDKSGFLNNLNNIKYASERVLQFTNYLDLLSGENFDEKEWVDLDINKIVKEAVSEVNLRREEKFGKNMDNIVLKSYLRSSSMIKGDLTNIKIAIINIILNAIEAMPEGGEILITTEDNAGSIYLYIQDSGIGIPDDIKENVFDPFFTTRGNGSLGLGLSLCERIIEGHGGKIEIISDRNQGCTIQIEIPKAIREKKTNSKLVNKAIRGARVLIIQDKDFLGEILSQMFSNKGLGVDTADSGLEGLGKIKKRKVSLIVADTTNLEMDPAIFIEKCRRINPDIRIVIIDGHIGYDNPKSVVSPKADLIITKPLDANRMVKNALNLIVS